VRLSFFSPISDSLSCLSSLYVSEFRACLDSLSIRFLVLVPFGDLADPAFRALLLALAVAIKPTDSASNEDSEED